MNEFSLIDEFFKSLITKRKDVLLGIGDDAACLQIPKGQDLLVSTDSLVAGVHFLPRWDAADIAYRAMMVNVSDMAAMAAEPAFATLALTLPEVDINWLKAFTKGLKAALDEFNIALVGGDTTHGPLSITVTIMGFAPHSQCLKRSGAKPGDVVMVSGYLGAAALAVQFLNRDDIKMEDKNQLMTRLLHPQARIDLISLLRTYATSAIDISDGLSADLNHICVASKVGACLNKEAIPIHPLLKNHLGDAALDLALTGGDDYELCFTVPAHKLDSLMQELKVMQLKCYPIGMIEEEKGLRMRTKEGQIQELVPRGYSHF